MLINRGLSVIAVILGCVVAQGCNAPPTQAVNGAPAVAGTTAAGKLAGTHWRLVEIQSMDDAIGTARPSDRNLYTMDLNADGTAALRLNCNRGRAAWSVKPVADDNEGGFLFTPLAMTRALCPPPSLDERIAKDLSFVRSFLIRDGRLALSLMADGGIYVWEPRKDGN